MSLDSFIDGYITTALWASTDESRDDGGDPLDDNYDCSDLAPETLANMERDCKAFYEANNTLWDGEWDDYGAGHDFWLTRNGHGAGFWDGRYPKHGNALTAASKVYGEIHLYIGDNGQIYGDRG